MSIVSDNGGLKEWKALQGVYNYLMSSYPNFRSQIDEFGFSVIESNDKGELLLEMDSGNLDIVIDNNKIVKLLKKEGLKKFSRVESLTLDEVLEYDYDMAKGLLNILSRRNKGGISLNLHFHHINGDGIPNIRDFLMKTKDSSWSIEYNFSDFTKVFGDLFISPLNKEGFYWIHMVKGNLRLSVVVGGDIIESREYGSDTVFDDKISKLLSVFDEMFNKPIKDIFLLGEDISKVRFKIHEDGEVTVVVY